MTVIHSFCISHFKAFTNLSKYLTSMLACINPMADSTRTVDERYVEEIAEIRILLINVNV